MNELIRNKVLEVAAKSPCQKRKVGAIIVNSKNIVAAEGFNYNPDGSCECEDSEGKTLPNVVHAEIAALEKLKGKTLETFKMYVSQKPCPNCLALMKAQGLTNYEVVEDFMKFDSSKLRFDLVPSSWERGDATVLTKGAVKYKPNNWKKIRKEEIMRYYAAARRHLDDWKAFMEGDPDGSLFDDGEMGIGTHHLLNARTNLGFLFTLTETLEKAEEIRDALSKEIV